MADGHEHTADPDAPPVAPKLRSHRALVLLLGALAAFGPLSIDMYLPSFPRLAQVFGASEASIQLTLSAYMIGVAGGQLVYGPLIDRFGRRRPLMLGLMLYIAASFGCAIAASVEQLMLWRLLQALGGAAGIVCCRAIVRDLFEPREGARALSMQILVMGAAPVLAPTVGGQMLLFADWWAIFVFLGLVGVACLFAVHRMLPETLPPQARAQRLALRRVISDYWRLLRHRQLIGFALTSGLGFAGMFAYIAGSPFVFVELYGVSPQRFSVLFGINAAGFIAASQVNARLLRHFEPEAILPKASMLYGVSSLVLVAVAATQWGGITALMMPLFATLCSLGMMAPNATVLALAPFRREAGTASALTGMLQLGAGALSGALVGIFANGTALPMAGIILAWAVLSALCLRMGLRAAQRARADQAAPASSS